MKAIGRLGAGLAVGALAVCCVLGPAAVVAGIAIGFGGIGFGAWIVAAAGILVAGAGALFMLARRRRGPRAACRARPPSGQSDETP